jgi:hypothetical protein
LLGPVWIVILQTHMYLGSLCTLACPVYWLRWSLTNFSSGLALVHDPPNLCLPGRLIIGMGICAWPGFLLLTYE